jgi:acetyl esterase/lipase
LLQDLQELQKHLPLNDRFGQSHGYTVLVGSQRPAVRAHGPAEAGRIPTRFARVDERRFAVPKDTTLHLPARDVPVPTSVSAEAQAVLALGSFDAGEDYPPRDDPDAWRRMIAAQDARVLALVGDRAFGFTGESTEIDVDGVRVYELVPDGLSSDDGRVLLEIHGGAFITGGGENCRIMGLRSVGRGDVRTWAIDYRMPPDHPYPASLDDCVRVYRRLVEERGPENVIVSGVSAGGNLAAALIVRARDEGMPMPAAAVLCTPAVDLTEAGDTYATNLGLDNLLPRSLMPANLLYADGHDLSDPYLSPLFADFTKGFPPTLLTSGTRDLFLSNTVRMHRALRAAGVEAELHVMEAGGHGGFLAQAPEDAAIEVEIRRFIAGHWAPTPS